jgi:hypothetical protein
MDIKLKKIIDILEESNKPVWLFANLKMDEFIDKWSIIISAPWITPKNEDESFEYLLGLLKENLNEKELSSIARVGLMGKDEHLVEELLFRDSLEPLKDTPINGNRIHEGYIIACNPEIEEPALNQAELFSA